MNRNLFFILFFIFVLFSGYLIWNSANGLWWLLLPAAFFGVGIFDIVQSKNAIWRNFPVIGHMRNFLSGYGPEIRQYFVENDTNGTPFNRLQRNVVFNRSHNLSGTHPFGTELNVYEDNYEWSPHSMFPAPLKQDAPRVLIGAGTCTRPYEASLLNISAMSYGSLSKNAILALNHGAKKGHFYHNTGEGGISPYHLAHGGDLVYQIGTGYFGCRNEHGHFDADRFVRTASHDAVKMIEIKLSQGAKPGHGGILPASKNTPEIAEIRGIAPYTSVHSPSHHTAFDDAPSMLHFIAKVRELSGGKPVGIKFCVGHKSEVEELFDAITELQIWPDFIAIDGGEGGTGAAPLEFSNHIGMPLEDGLVIVSNKIIKYNMKDHIKLIASGKIVTGYDIFKMLAIGADLCASARGMMIALGCIQALKCDLNTCPAGVATQDKYLMRGLVPAQKFEKVFNFHHNTLKSFLEIIAACGFSELSQINRNMIFQRTNSYTSRTFDDLYPPSRFE